MRSSWWNIFILFIWKIHRSANAARQMYCVRTMEWTKECAHGIFWCMRPNQTKPNGMLPFLWTSHRQSIDTISKWQLSHCISVNFLNHIENSCPNTRQPFIWRRNRKSESGAVAGYLWRVTKKRTAESLLTGIAENTNESNCVFLCDILSKHKLFWFTLRKAILMCHLCIHINNAKPICIFRSITIRIWAHFSSLFGSTVRLQSNWFIRKKKKERFLDRHNLAQPNCYIHVCVCALLLSIDTAKKLYIKQTCSSREAFWCFFVWNFKLRLKSLRRNKNSI